MFKENDVVCFLGDSITMDGRWVAEIFENVKDKNVRVFNCGIGGDKSWQGLQRIYYDCLSRCPNYVVVKFGMNDVHDYLYYDTCTMEENARETEKIEALDIYKGNICKILDVIIKANATPILCTPTPYDEISDLPAYNKTFNVAMTKCKEIIFDLGKQYNVKVVDLNKAMNKANKTMSVIREDRSHPNKLGNHIMAQVFMQATGIIEKTDIEKEFIMSEKNKKRFMAEYILRAFTQVEFRGHGGGVYDKHIPFDERKENIYQRLDNLDESKEFKDEFKMYLEKINYKEQIIDDLVKYTL